MSEVAVAFPNDETTAEVIASRLRADGIAARVDRGLYGSAWQVSARGQVTVLVDTRDAAHAHRILGTKPEEPTRPGLFDRVALALLATAVVVGVVAIAVAIATR